MIAEKCACGARFSVEPDKASPSGWERAVALLETWRKEHRHVEPKGEAGQEPQKQGAFATTETTYPRYFERLGRDYTVPITTARHPVGFTIEC